MLFYDIKPLTILQMLESEWAFDLIFFYITPHKVYKHFNSH